MPSGLLCGKNIGKIIKQMYNPVELVATFDICVKLARISNENLKL